MKFLFMLYVLFSSDYLIASGNISDSNCTGRSFAWDFRDDFRTEQGGFDWCFQRVTWWGLDKSDGWRGRYCRSRRYTGGYNQWRWSNHFRHQFHEYRGRGGFDVFNNFSRFYSGRVFRGFPSRIEFSFDPDCRSSSGYD